MNKFKPSLLFFILIIQGCLGTLALAAGPAFFSCSLNSFAKPGDALDTVLSVCGEPISRKDYVERERTKQHQTVWHYVYNKFNNFGFAAAPDVSQLNVIFAEGKVISMNISEDMSVGDSVTCGYASNNSRNINLDDTYSMVRNKCGSPRYVSTHTRDVVGPEMAVTELVYSKGQFMPATTLIFKDGILANIR